MEECLESVVNQTFKDIEIICILDGSTDQSETILNRYAERDERIIILKQTNQGLSVARNRGLAIAAGEYIAFIDSDDWVSPRFIEKLYEAAETNHTEMACCNYYHFKGDIAHPNPPLTQGVFESPTVCRELIRDVHVKNYAWNKLIKRMIFDSYNISFPERLIFEDIAIMSQIAYRCKNIAIIDECLYFYRIRKTSISNATNPKRHKDIIIALGMIKEFLMSENIYDKYRAEFEYNCATKLISNIRTICRKEKQFADLISPLINEAQNLFDAKDDILPQTKRMLSFRKRISLKLIMSNYHIYKTITSLKLI